MRIGGSKTDSQEHSENSGLVSGVIVLSTFPSEDLAKKVAQGLLERKLCACVNIMKVSSIYSWKGKIEDEQEFLCFFKTTTIKLRQLKEEIRKVHPYEVPEIAELEMKSASSDYLSWMVDATLSSP
ncbi:MAG: divalent-cation tolerance protein CutA [Nitrososphaeraceae archaeon]